MALRAAWEAAVGGAQRGLYAALGELLHAQGAKVPCRPPEKTLCSPGAYETLVVLDWDDTLCPTHWCGASGLGLDRPCKEEHLAPLRELSGAVCDLLRRASQVGRVVIVTNARGQCWVEESSARLLPEVAALLRELRVPVVVYARQAFHGWDPAGTRDQVELHPDEAHAGRTPEGTVTSLKEVAVKRSVTYKKVAFARLLRAAPRWRAVVSIGDSETEHLACKSACRERPNEGLSRPLLVQTAKLRPAQPARDLAQQLRVVCGWLARLGDESADLAT